MEQLFVIQRYKPFGDEKPEGDKKKEFSAALDELLQQARNRQQLQVKSVTNDTNSESPRTEIKRKLFQSPQSLKGSKKVRTSDEAFTTPQEKENNTSNLIPSSTGTDLTNKASKNSLQNYEKKQQKKKKTVNEKVDVDENADVMFSNLSNDSPRDTLELSCKPKKKFKLFRNKRNKQTESEILNEVVKSKTLDVEVTDLTPTAHHTPSAKSLNADVVLPNKVKANRDAIEELDSKPKKKLKLFRNKKNKQANDKISTHDAENASLMLTEQHIKSTESLTGDVALASEEISNHDIDINNNLSTDQNNPTQKEDQADLHEGFTVIGEVMKKTTQPVSRMLPSWLQQPTVLSSNLQDKKMLVSDMNMLDALLLTALEENGVTHFFPVQQEVIPWVLKSLSTASFFRPRDICVSAPTGSGKTLSYVLPLIHAIMNRLVPVVRVLVVLPVKDLASQVFKVFQSYIKSTNLKVALISGHKPHAVEAKKLVRPNIKGGFSSLVDIVIATPGSLMHHIQRTEGFSLHNLRFLVIDEADRMIEDIQEGWLSAVEKAIQSRKMHSCQCRGKPNSGRLLSGPIIACCLKRPVEPCQKLLFSATLSHDPEKLKMLSLFCPKLFTTVASSKYHVDRKQEVIENFSTPEELTEATITCEPQMKPLTLWYLLLKKHYTRVLCFTNTVENSHRLTLLLKELGDVEVRELSSNLKDQQRKSILNQFSSGKIDILVCSDMLARGMDLNNVQCVICYDPPSYIKTYIHRIGRTARAGLVGTALSLLYKEEHKEFNKLMKLGSRPPVKRHPFDLRLMDVFHDHYQNALEAVSAQLAENAQKLRQSRNIFQKSKKSQK